MSLEKKVFFHDRLPKSPSLNLAINKAIVHAIKAGKYDAVGRVYYHTNGIILGNNESKDDIYQNNCGLYGFEVVTRPTGGSAILVTPELNMCYSIFFHLKRTNRERNTTKLYMELTLPLQEFLGEQFDVQGKYYLRVRHNGSYIPFAGHSLHLSKDLVQFDGVVHKHRLDPSFISNFIKLRELHKLGDEKYIRMDNAIYNNKGSKVENITLSSTTIVRSEKEELERVLGLQELNIREEDYADSLYKLMCTLFDDVVKIDTLQLNQKKILVYQMRLSHINNGRVIGLGHCFIDFMEAEPALKEVS